MSLPIKSSSIIILRPTKFVEKNDFYDYEVLFMKRSVALPYGNTYSFPSGAIQKDDFAYIRNSSTGFALNVSENQDLKYHIFKAAAIRIAYEDCGIMIFSNPVSEENMKNSLSSLAAKSKKSKLTYKDVTRAFDLQYEDSEEVIEIMRTVSPMSRKLRYDTQIFVVSLTKDYYVNVHTGINDLAQREDLEKLTIADDYDFYMWANPNKMLKMYMNKEIEMDLPHFLLTNILTSFKTSTALVKYLKTIQYNALNCLSKNILQRTILTFPFHFITKPITEPHLIQRGMYEKILMESDFTFPFDDILKGQKDSHWKEELSYLYKRVQNSENSRFQLYYRKGDRVPSLLGINLDYDMPLTLIKNIQEIKTGSGYGSL